MPSGLLRSKLCSLFRQSAALLVQPTNSPGLFKLSERREKRRNRAGAKAPPLIYLGREFSPIVYPRKASLVKQLPEVNDKVFDEVLRKLPFRLSASPTIRPRIATTWCWRMKWTRSRIRIRSL